MINTEDMFNSFKNLYRKIWTTTIKLIYDKDQGISRLLEYLICESSKLFLKIFSCFYLRNILVKSILHLTIQSFFCSPYDIGAKFFLYHSPKKRNTNVLY